MHTVVDLYIALQHGEAAVLMCKHGVVQGVHGFGGGFLAEADTECASGFLFGKAQGGNYMAGLSLVAVAAGGTVGGTVIYRTQQTKKNRVDVMPVANLTQYWWGDDLSMDGQVISGDVQNVTPSDDQMIAKVLVKQGDHVTKGTPLLDYDMTAVGLEVAQKQTALAVAQENVRQAQKELERLKKLRPSEAAPVVPDRASPQ